MLRIIAAIVTMIVLCYALSGCGTVKGIAHDLSWTANKVDQAIVVPEE